MGGQRENDLQRITSSLFTAKRSWNDMCQSIAELYYPIRADFTSELSLGVDFGANVFDGFTINSRETLQNAIDSMLRQGEWFEVTTGDDERDKRIDNAVALKRASQQLRSIVSDPRGNFSVATKECDGDWVSFGTNIMSIEESTTRDYLVHKPWHPKTCAWMVDDNGAVNALHRRFSMSCRNIKRKFATKAWRGKLGKEIDECKDPMQMFPICHILMPTDEIYGDDAGKRREIRHKYVSIYLDETNNEILNEQGSKVFNYSVGRWRRLGNVPWGFSPAAYNSMPDGRMLQDMARVLLEQGEKAVDPPIVGASDIFTRDINLFAGGFTHVDLEAGSNLRDMMTTVETSNGIQTGLQMKQDVRSLIADAWLLNKLFLPNVRDMRELEVATRNDEFRRAALPFFTPIDTEYHSPILSISFEMGINMGLIEADGFPEELHDQDIKFRFTSPLKEAEGQKVVAAYQTSMALIAAGAQADPELTKQFDIAEATIDAVRGAGAEPGWILPEDVRKQNAAVGKQKQDLMEGADAIRTAASVAQDIGNASMTADAAGLGA